MEQIKSELLTMRLPGMAGALQTLRESRRIHELSFTDGLRILVQAERDQRETNRYKRLVKNASFRYQACIEELSFDAARGLDRNQVLSLANGSYIRDAGSILVTGATGCGKSFVASALGHQACRQGFSVMYFGMQHEAGDKMFVDYAGKKLHHVEYGTGEIIECEFFVSVLGQSQYTYAEASPSQRKEDFISSVQKALHYYGGVPKVLVPDNLKSAVSKSGKYDPALNEDFLDMANHYGCGVLPARSRKPRDKSLVENHIRTLYTRVHAELSQVTFFSLEELNGAILRCLEKHNGVPFQGKDYSRRQVFEQTEREALNPLPDQWYEIKKTKQVTVMKNCHVQLSDDRHYYSVPYRHIGEKVKLSYTSKEVCVYLKGERVAFHLRDRKPYKYTTVKEHLPSHHRFVSEWNPEKFINWAAGISPEVKTYIEGVLSQKNYPETLYRACVGILSFAKKAGKERLVTACRMGIRMETYNYGFISKVLANNTDKLWAEGEQAANDRKLPGHENLRGSDYYKDMCND